VKVNRFRIGFGNQMKKAIAPLLTGANDNPLRSIWKKENRTEIELKR